MCIFLTPRHLSIYFVFMCECVCVYDVCTCVQVPRGAHWPSCFVTLWLIPLRQGLPLILEPGWQPAGSSGSPLSHPTSLGLPEDMPIFLCGCWGFECQSIRILAEQIFFTTEPSPQPFQLLCGVCLQDFWPFEGGSHFPLSAVSLAFNGRADSPVLHCTFQS